MILKVVYLRKGSTVVKIWPSCTDASKEDLNLKYREDLLPCIWYFSSEKREKKDYIVSENLRIFWLPPLSCPTFALHLHILKMFLNHISRKLFLPRKFVKNSNHCEEFNPACSMLVVSVIGPEVMHRYIMCFQGDSS